MGRLPSGIVSFLFTDIEGSTRLFRRIGDEYLSVLEEHNRVLRAVWKKTDGHEVKTEGDSFFVAFASAFRALNAAVAAQEALRSHSWPIASPLVRIGIHSGLAAPVGNDYVALAVHQAARVVAAAHGGQVLATEESVGLAAEEGTTTAHPVGRYRLQGFDDPVLLYQVSTLGSIRDFPRVRAIPADGHNIPRPLTSFIGRGEDVAGVLSLLDESRLVTIQGPGGVGKSRLAKEVGIGAADSFDGGVWIADLSSLELAAPVDGAIADAIGVEPRGRSPTAALSDRFGVSDVLLILDNCEHVRDPVRTVAGALLRDSPGLKIVATTRAALGVDYESLWHLDPLPVGAGNGGAERLFLARAGSQSRASEAVHKLCLKLDGMPLALELAAARARTTSPEAVLAMLDDPSHLLRVRQPAGDPRQESLAATVDWSFGLLDSIEQRVFLRLGVFGAGFSQSMGCQAAIDDTLSREEVVDAIWSLADNSLLERITASDGMRYRMLNMVRSYANDRIDERDRVETARRIALSFLGRVGPWIPVTPDWTSEMRVEAKNIRALVAVLAQFDPETAQLLAITVLKHLDVEADYVSANTEAEEFAAQLHAVTPVRPALLAQVARSRRRLGRFDNDDLLDDARRNSGVTGGVPNWASAWVTIEQVEMLQAVGQTDVAIDLAREALAAELTEEGRREWLEQIGMMLMEDKPAEGIEYLERGLAMTPQERLYEYATLNNNIAETLMRLDDRTGAARHQLQALQAGMQIGMPILVALSLIVAARLSALETSWEVAVRLHAAASRFIEESGIALYSDDVELSEQMLGDARQVLGTGFDALWESGHAETLDSAAVEGAEVLKRINAL